MDGRGGLKVRSSHASAQQVRIKRVCLHSVSACGRLTIYIYHLSLVVAIASRSCWLFLVKLFSRKSIKHANRTNHTRLRDLNTIPKHFPQQTYPVASIAGLFMSCQECDILILLPGCYGSSVYNRRQAAFRPLRCGEKVPSMTKQARSIWGKVGVAETGGSRYKETFS